MHNYFLILINDGAPLCTIQRSKTMCNELLVIMFSISNCASKSWWATRSSCRPR